MFKVYTGPVPHVGVEARTDGGPVVKSGKAKVGDKPVRRTRRERAQAHKAAVKVNDRLVREQQVYASAVGVQLDFLGALSRTGDVK